LERKIASWSSGQPVQLQRQWRPWKELPDPLKMAVIAAEDQKFDEHWGFDLGAIQAALAHNQTGGSLRGASTLSQQVAKNLLLWSKERILEVYLNSVEWGDGTFGAEAAAQHHFGISAPYLDARQASQLAAVLPNPHRWSAGRPDAHVLRRANWIRQQVHQLGGSHYLNRLKTQAPDWWPKQ